MPRYLEPCVVSVSGPQHEFAVDPESREDLESCRQQMGEVLMFVKSGHAGGQRRRSERGNAIQPGLNFGHLVPQPRVSLPPAATWSHDYEAETTDGYPA